MFGYWIGKRGLLDDVIGGAAALGNVVIFGGLVVISLRRYDLDAMRRLLHFCPRNRETGELIQGG